MWWRKTISKLGVHHSKDETLPFQVQGYDGVKTYRCLALVLWAQYSMEDSALTPAADSPNSHFWQQHR